MTAFLDYSHKYNREIVHRQTRTNISSLWYHEKPFILYCDFKFTLHNKNAFTFFVLPNGNICSYFSHSDPYLGESCTRVVN